MQRDPPKALSILKPLYGRGNDGRYGIQHLAVVPLAARAQDASDFFQIQNDLLHAQPNYVSTVLATLGQSIVPVVAVVRGERLIRCLGTGFFVSASGLFITAAHVIIDPIERSYGGAREIEEMTWAFDELEVGVLTSTNPIFEPEGWIFRPIEWASFLAQRAEHPLPIPNTSLKLTTDIAICKARQSTTASFYQPLSIIQQGIRGLGLAIGKRATAIGYAGMQDVAFEENQVGARIGDIRFNLHVASGYVLEHFPNNLSERVVRTPGACFAAALKLPGGMSGSPVFDDEHMYVHGVVSSGWEGEGGPIKHGYGSMLGHSLSIPIRPLSGKTLTDLIREGEHGMPQISIAGA